MTLEERAAQAIDSPIWKYVDEEEYSRILQAVQAALAEAQRWIPVAERLPELDALVAWFSPGNGTWSRAFGKLIKYDNRLYVSESNRETFDLYKHYSHWQPLPPPPEAQ